MDGFAQQAFVDEGVHAVRHRTGKGTTCRQGSAYQLREEPHAAEAGRLPAELRRRNGEAGTQARMAPRPAGLGLQSMPSLEAETSQQVGHHWT